MSELATGVKIDVALVSKLVGAQFPRWANLPIKRVEFDGWDNRTFRLGETMSVRLPSAERYAAQVEKEHRWLPLLSLHLPIPIPVPLEMGFPAEGYPWHWSVYKWLEGEDASVGRMDDLCEFATSLGDFLGTLQQIDSTGGPSPGRHNFFRGGPVATYDKETRQAISGLNDVIDARLVTEVWESAHNAVWHGSPVWIHGDMSAGNLLVENGRLSAVIDFGCSGIGDPACDLTIAWTRFSDRSREAFRASVPADEGTWARARGWALWKGLITLVEHRLTGPEKAAEARRVIDEVLADHVATARGG